MFSTLHDRSDGLRMDWYKTQSAKQPRTVGWKTGKSFEPKHLYFRTVDTGRMLPMHCAEFRTQFWAHKSFWTKIEGNGTEDFLVMNFATMVRTSLSDGLVTMVARLVLEEPDSASYFRGIELEYRACTSSRNTLLDRLFHCRTLSEAFK